MKLVRYGLEGRERPGIVDAKGNIRDLSNHIGDIARDALSSDSLERLGLLDMATLDVVEPGLRLGPCVGAVSKLIGVGLNYRDHALELGLEIPREPIVFGKAISSISGPNDDVVMPKGSTKVAASAPGMFHRAMLLIMWRVIASSMMSRNANFNSKATPASGTRAKAAILLVRWARGW